MYGHAGRAPEPAVALFCNNRGELMNEMPYSKPTLTQFGKVTELTHAASGKGGPNIDLTGGKQKR
jgi:hypothetical protein